MKTRFVRELLDHKGREVYGVRPDASVIDALQEMADRNVGALVVLEEDDMIGIFSERDYARKVALRGRSARETPVREIMTSVVATVEPDQTVEECMELMTSRRVRHLPVTQEGALVGIISIGDVVNSIIDGQQFVIRQLENYITGNA